MRKSQIELVLTSEMYYLVVNAEIKGQILSSEHNLTAIRAEAFQYCIYYGKCIAIEWWFNGSREELEAKLKKKI